MATKLKIRRLEPPSGSAEEVAASLSRMKKRKAFRHIIKGTKQFLKDVVGSADMSRKDVKEIGEEIIGRLK
jgi:hypothetical protein